MISELLREKFVAFLKHLAFSICLGWIFLILLLTVWYIPPLIKAMRMSHFLLMMLGIDIVAGPLLTFIVYKKGKKSLKFDLMVIILLQLGLFLYGGWNIVQSRPVWFVYDNNKFVLIRNNEVNIDSQQRAIDKFQHNTWLKPKWVGISYPKNDENFAKKIELDELMYGIIAAQKPELYSPLDTMNNEIARQALPTSLLEQYNDSTQVKTILSKYPIADSFVPLKATAVDMTVLIDKKSGGKVVAIVDLRPW